MTLQLTSTHALRIRATIALALGLASVALTGCQSIDYRQAAYSVLRHEDCRRNEMEEFCTRSYHREYYEYERVRNEFLRDTQATTGSLQQWGTLSKTSTEL